MERNVKRIIIALPIILAVAAVIYLIISAAAPGEKYITGIVETTVVDVASKIPGRIDTLYVQEGETVRKGTVLAKLESKEIDAKVGQAESLMKAAKAKMALVKEGARSEQKDMVEKLMLQAKHQFEFAEKTYDRFKILYEDSLISRQSFDEIEFKYKSANEQYEATKSNYKMVMSGARKEEKEAVTALYEQAMNGYNEAKAYEMELQLKAPVTGEVYNIISDAGEVITSGYPVFSLMLKDDAYVVIQLREDMMSQFEMHKEFTGRIAALDTEAKFKVDYIAPMADFATWRPTNQKGEFDLKTFEVRLTPVDKIEGLRPGMTVNIKL